MHPGKVPLAAQKLSMNPDGCLALQKTDSIGHTLWRGKAETQGHRIGHGVPLPPRKALRLAQLPQQWPNTPSELPIDDTPSVRWHKNSGIRAIPSDVRWAWPCSHGDLLASERGGSWKGGLYDISLHDGTAEPRGVAPPEAVAYLM